jgi:hypothetical protein
MAGSALSESKTSNLVVFSRSGCFGLNSNRPSDGLTIEETIEFKAIEALPPFDENGNIAWTFEGEPITTREKRWLELYVKQELAGQKGKREAGQWAGQHTPILDSRVRPTSFVEGHSIHPPDGVELPILLVDELTTLPLAPSVKFPSK